MKAQSPVTVPPEYRQTVYIGKPATEVWAALTTKALVDQYYMVPLMTPELKNGERIAYGGDKAVIAGTVTEFDAPRKFTHTFDFSGTEGPVTTVTYEIEPLGSTMCALRLTHLTFREENKQLYTDISQGWPVILSSLKTLLETGKPLPWPKD